ncbi:hypothetical protein [Niallia sp. MER 6]|uniref:hypothetical protein n=1 Tax=Niallia sp. MER 6 TaxID=2939567 RepID=UPI00203BB92D|nr:hypothetical protein [Niallia sp. MER 6]MCM3034315.1 hypothetical protein [Niallia sp. MER 6]
MQEPTEYLTFLIDGGIVCGKLVEIKEVDATNYVTLVESLEKFLGDSNGIDAFSITDSMFKGYYNDEDRENPAIPLTDVQFRMANGKVIHTRNFVLFADKVIGLFLGKSNLEDWGD